MKTLLNTVLLMVLMLALIAVHKAWRDYGENMESYRQGTALSLVIEGKISPEEYYKMTYPRRESWRRP